MTFTARTYGGDEKPRMGFFTDTSLCIGCKACEVACKEWNQIPQSMQGFTGKSYDNTVELGADTWRHVAFIEQRKELTPGGGLVEQAALEQLVREYRERSGAYYEARHDEGARR